MFTVSIWLMGKERTFACRDLCCTVLYGPWSSNSHHGRKLKGNDFFFVVDVRSKVFHASAIVYAQRKFGDTTIIIFSTLTRIFKLWNWKKKGKKTLNHSTNIEGFGEKFVNDASLGWKTCFIIRGTNDRRILEQIRGSRLPSEWIEHVPMVLWFYWNAIVDIVEITLQFALVKLQKSHQLIIHFDSILSTYTYLYI